MTKEEAILFLDPNTTGAALRDKTHDEAIPLIEEACRIAIADMEDAEEYRWHDLRKNKDDLPPDVKTCEICIKVPVTGEHVYRHAWYSGSGAWEAAGSDAEYPARVVIAWRRIRPFTEGA